MKKKNTAKSIKKPPKPAKKLAKAATVSREVPEPDRVSAPKVRQLIMEHAYWLGQAVHQNDKKRMDSEFKAMKVMSRMYFTFASPPVLTKQKIPPKSSNNDVAGEVANIDN